MTTDAAETPDVAGAHPRLTDAQLAMLENFGSRRETTAGDVLLREGDVDYDFFVVLAGKVATVDESGPTPEIIAVHGPGRFVGDLSLLTGQAAPFTAVVRENGAVLHVPSERLRAIAARDPQFGDLILRACLARRSALIGRPQRAASYLRRAQELIPARDNNPDIRRGGTFRRGG